MSSEIAIKVENLSKRYQIYDQPRDRLKQFILPRMRRMVGAPSAQYFREFWALRDVSFEVKRGETVGIIGRNGSGKSTLLQMICGTLNPTYGSLQTKGRIAALLELGSGFNPEFTGRENVFLNAAVLGLSQQEVEACFDDIVAFADIGHFLDQPVKTYSSGMVVRLAFAVQAMINPDIFVVDEALAVGDEKFQRKCFARLEELKSRGTSILFVSHSAASIIELCERSLVLDKGSRLMYGAAPQAVRAYQKLLYAPQAEYEALVREIRAADVDANPTGDSDNQQADATLTDAVEVKDAGAAFDPGLVPDTTTVYPSQGAEIRSIAFRDESGRVVNVLQAGETYHLEMEGVFSKSFAGVFFGIHLRNIQGAVVTGQRYPEEGRYVTNVRAGTEFKLRFAFSMSLIQGAYFAGGGIWSAEEPTCAHRILDAVMFRIAPTEKQKSFGYVDLAASEPTLDLAAV
ncbi:ABC transporter ATP-binding protein [Paraburkholderia phenoliruptrix]|uniref:ABC transporter ATP-binding protein n=1 Tax=Paraburkholderia phenoliruptrix TaxID=252970 RepID=UPI001C6DFE87|nr:ABC transporter ATP-binding protein [Paraburkholderia phenoliruptrix]MBW9105243.1 ABC transporter ATP-binding protein [Paraburkholderia phenoliruptrix]MBW9129889.1 ABC transporter ATP-binding protein [Paraburkholderia ginsengiterrae]